jgi:hypothetical protein
MKYSRIDIDKKPSSIASGVVWLRINNITGNSIISNTAELWTKVIWTY